VNRWNLTALLALAAGAALTTACQSQPGPGSDPDPSPGVAIVDSVRLYRPEGQSAYWRVCWAGVGPSGQPSGCTTIPGDDRVTDIVRLGDDYVVEVTARNGAITFTTVVDEVRTSTHWETQQEAVLHLIARRYQTDAMASMNTVFYAGRVLGVGTTPVESR
jgi:hypothetical protein